MIQGKCPLISIPLIKKSMSPWKNLTICCGFIPADRLCFQLLTRGTGFFFFFPPFPSEQTGGVCIEVDGKQIQLFYLSINALEYAVLKTGAIPVRSLSFFLRTFFFFFYNLETSNAAHRFTITFFFGGFKAILQQLVL